MPARLENAALHTAPATLPRAMAVKAMEDCTVDGSSDREIINVGDDKKAFGIWLLDSRRIAILAETMLPTTFVEVHDDTVLVHPTPGLTALRPRDVVAGPDEAQFTFDALLNGTTVREAIPGSVQRIGPAWQVTRASMCAALALAALTCPA